ncbi:GNAT family N-acetyltransferase, partial [Parabacteroides goldsteinii]|uniref:GNAT family N-acetyltransferase n=1 Tax=Parabacteroides goldsteinii TaxID=328812 RepID=UPI00242F8C71
MFGKVRQTKRSNNTRFPDYTGKGYGRLLMNQLIEDCRNRSFHALVACITIPNEPSVKLHERLN